MSDQSDALSSTEPSYHVVTIPPELPDDDMDLDSWFKSWLDRYQQASQVDQRGHSVMENWMHPNIFRRRARQARRKRFLINSLVNSLMHNQMNPVSFCQALQVVRQARRKDDMLKKSLEILEEGLRSSEVFDDLALTRRRQTREVRYDGRYRKDDISNGLFGNLGITRRRQDRNGFGSGLWYREGVRRPGVLNTLASQIGLNLAVMRELALMIPEDFLRQTAYFSEQVRPEVLNTPASQTGLNLAVMRELALMIPEDFLRQILRRLRQAYRREHFGMNVEVPGNLPASQAYQRPQGEWYTFIGLIFTISCGIYGILLVLTEQMYKEEDGSFFSHHGVMVTISVLAMVYAAFSGVFLGVVYHLATADPTNTYRKRMRFLWVTFVYAACFGPTVMFMAMFVQPLGLKVCAWAVLGATLTRAGFCIRD